MQKLYNYDRWESHLNCNHIFVIPLFIIISIYFVFLLNLGGLDFGQFWD